MGNDNPKPLMMMFYLKVSQSAPTVLSDQATGCSPSRTASSLSKKDSQYLQSSSNWLIRLIDTNTFDLPQEMQAFISQSDFHRAPMRDSFRGQLASWSSILEGKLAVARPIYFSTLKPTMFTGDAFLIASFNCWCKLNRAMMHGTLFVTRSAFIFIASVFGSYDEVLVIRFSSVERITKLNISDVDSLVQLDMNRPFFLGMNSAIRLDFTTDSGVSTSAILFGITVDSNVDVPIDGSVDQSGKKSPSIFAAMYNLLSLTKNRQEAERSDVQPLAREAPKKASMTSSSAAGPSLTRSSSSFHKAGSMQPFEQLQSIQESAKVPFDDAPSRLSSSQRGKRLSSQTVHEAASLLIRHINAHRNCYESSFTSRRFINRDPPIMTLADWDALAPFIWYASLHIALFAHLLQPHILFLFFTHFVSFQRHGVQYWRVRRIPRPFEALFTVCEQRQFCVLLRDQKEHRVLPHPRQQLDIREYSRCTEFRAAVRFNHFTHLYVNPLCVYLHLRRRYACEPRSSLLFLQVPLESIPSAPEGFEHRLINFVLSVAFSSFAESKVVLPIEIESIFISHIVLRESSDR